MIGYGTRAIIVFRFNVSIYEKFMGLGYAPLERLGSIFENLMGGTRAGGIFSVVIVWTFNLFTLCDELSVESKT